MALQRTTRVQYYHIKRLEKALAEIPALHEEFRNDVRILGGVRDSIRRYPQRHHSQRN